MTRARRIGLIVAAIIVAFLVGFFWQFARAEQLSRALDAAQRQLAVTRAEATLGAAVIEAQRGSYETSRGLASDFFTGVQRNVEQQQASAPPTFTTILNQRDSVITLLSRSDSQAVGMLSRIFVAYRTAVGR